MVPMVVWMHNFPPRRMARMATRMAMLSMAMMAMAAMASPITGSADPSLETCSSRITGSEAAAGSKLLQLHTGPSDKVSNAAYSSESHVLESMEERLLQKMEKIEEKLQTLETEKRAKTGEIGEEIGEKIKEELKARTVPYVASQTDPSLFQGCKSTARLPVLVEASKASKASIRSSANLTTDSGDPWNSLCASNEFVVRSNRLLSRASACCSESNLDCAGCDPVDSCASCVGGFLKRGGRCVACADSPGWRSLSGDTCAQLSASSCSDVAVRGLSSKEACCKCGGGHITPTPFAYRAKSYAFGDPVHSGPRPRTASSYSVAETCELSKWNLTLDGSTGTVSVASNRQAPSKSFSIECTIFAHQDVGVISEATMKISMDYLAYESAYLLFPNSQATYPIRKAPGSWWDFELTCAPQVPWLQVNAATGDLTASTFTAAGAVGLDDMTGTQDGGICVVTAWHKTAHGLTQQQVSFAALRPHPVTSMSYNLNQLQVTLGQTLPALEVSYPSSPNTKPTKPSTFRMGCEVWPQTLANTLQFTFDTLLGVGLMEGYPLLEISETGAISISPDPGLASLFEDPAHDFDASTGVRRKIGLECKVWGLFFDDLLGSVSSGRLRIDILDNICWVEKNVTGRAFWTTNDNEGDCRQGARKYVGNPLYSWSATGNPKCQIIDLVGNQTFTAFAKVTNCTAEATCMEVSSADWYQNGLYCPVAPDLSRNGMVYRKEGLTPQETLLLAKYSSTLDSSETGCNNGDWILRRTGKEDYINEKTGAVSLQGDKLLCLGPSSQQIALGVKSCPAPVLQSPEEEALPPMVVDDPSTPEAEDFWLHPCDCAPHAWGMEPPVDAEAHEKVPSGSRNEFIPKPFLLVEGQFACPSDQLITVHTEGSEEAADFSNCEAKCAGTRNPDCTFFWHGIQQEVSACRLYSGCSHLLREIGLEGSLMTMPRHLSCQVASPELCFSTTFRREYLTGSGTRTSSFQWKDLHVHCDIARLLGGGGVEACGNPTYRSITSHDWSHKMPLPETFDHGETLEVRCWSERYSGMLGSDKRDVLILNCVNGEWFSRIPEPELGIGRFRCEACVQVGASGYQEAADRKQQELWFFQRVKLRLFTDVLAPAANQVHCLEFVNGRAVMEARSSCPATFRTQFGGTSGGSRQLLLGPNQCLELQEGNAPDPVVVDWTGPRGPRAPRSLVMEPRSADLYSYRERPCATDPAQQIPMGNMPNMLASMHRTSFIQSTRSTYGNPGLLDCSGHGGVGGVDFSDLFDTASEVFNIGRIEVASRPASWTTGDIDQWKALNWEPIRFDATASDWAPDATKIRLCGTQTDSTVTPFSLRLREGLSTFFRDWVDKTGWLEDMNHAHVECHRWHDISGIDCYSGTKDCKVEALPDKFLSNLAWATNSRGEQVQMSPLWLELGTQDVAWKYRMQGTVPLWGDTRRQAKGMRRWTTGTSEFILEPAALYPDATEARMCASYTVYNCGSVAQPWMWLYLDFGLVENWQHAAVDGKATVHCGTWKSLTQFSNFQCDHNKKSCYVQFSSAHCEASLGRVYFEFGTQQFHGPTPTFLSRYDLYSSFTKTTKQAQDTKATLGSGKWHKFYKPSAATEFRLCATFSDNAISGDTRITAVTSDGDADVFEETLGRTGSTDIAAIRCGQWRDIATLRSCWEHHCKFEVSHSETNVEVQVHPTAYIEFRKAAATREDVNYAKATGWEQKLAAGPVQCPPGQALTKLDMRGSSGTLLYQCGTFPGLGMCSEGWTQQEEVDFASWKEVGKLQILCDDLSLLTGFHYEFSKGGQWQRFRYSCCKSGGLLMGIEKDGLEPIPSGAVQDGVYCPNSRDASGRMTYERSTSTSPQLFFEASKGEWCLDSDCIFDAVVVPIGLAGQSFDVVAVSDFDGTFGEGAEPGIPGAGGVGGSRKPPRPPPRPKAPRAPMLQGFAIEEPTYAKECVEYGELWTSIQETYKDLDGQTRPHTTNLLAEEIGDSADSDSMEANPCTVAGAVGGTYGEVGSQGQKQGAVPTPLSYQELSDCVNRDVVRDVAKASVERDESYTELWSEIGMAGLQLACAPIPDTAATGFGVGPIFRLGQICDAMSNLVGAMKKGIQKGVKSVKKKLKPPPPKRRNAVRYEKGELEVPPEEPNRGGFVDLEHAQKIGAGIRGLTLAAKKYSVEAEEAKDCHASQANFARLFCDIHCVRDAVLRGDRNILRNLKAASDVVNENLKKMVEWSVAANRAETGWLAEKIDVSEERIKVHNSNLLEEAHGSMKTMLLELSGFAES
ncbi:ACBP2, partial [Symbiodinium sp. CCMP2592]